MRSSKPVISALFIAAVLLLLAMPAAVANDTGEGSDEHDAAAGDESEETRIRHIVDTSTNRTPAKTAFPDYPRIARRDRIEGDATVCFRINKEGRIYSVKVREVTHRIFRRAALRAIRASSFKPLAPDEILETARSCRTYSFRLEPVLASEDSP